MDESICSIFSPDSRIAILIFTVPTKANAAFTSTFLLLADKAPPLHLLIQIPPLLLMLKIRDELPDSLNHLRLRNPLIIKDTFQLPKERRYLVKRLARSLLHHTQRLEAS